MTIVLINDHASMNGGAASVVIQEAIGFAQAGERVIYFGATGPAEPSLAAAGVEVICLDQPDINTAPSAIGFTRIATWNFPAQQRLAQILSTLDRKTSIVHLHSWAKVLSPSVGRAIRKSRLPCVVTSHDYFWVCPNGGFFDYRKNEICHRTPLSVACWKTDCDQKSHARKLWRSGRHLLLNHVSGIKAYARHLVTLSATQENALRPFLSREVQLHRVDNPIAVTDPGPRAATQPMGEFLFVGRLSPEKGVDLMCRVAETIGVRVRIAGDGPQKAELMARYPSQNFLGWKNAAEITQEMRIARALIFPSILYEGQPLTVQESLANGCPVIASDAGAAKEAVIDGANGLWFRSGDAKSLEQAMTKMRDDALAGSMAREAHARYWRDPLTLERHLDRLRAVYRAAMTG